MRIERFTVGPLLENCYLLADEQSARAVLIDPGEEAERLLAALAGAALELEAIWLTHAHFDHVGALAALCEARPVPVFLHPADGPLLAAASASAALWGFDLRQPGPATDALEDGLRLDFAGAEVRCLHTPGHAPGHISFYLPSAGVVIAGDALFRGSIGRTDLPGGDTATLLASIRGKLLTLPPETVVLPGHGPETTIAIEAATNPFLTGSLG